MNITSINFNIASKNFYTTQVRESTKPATNPVCIKVSPVCDCVSFSGIANGGDILKRLCAYGVPDMYTGQILLDPKIIERMENRNVFNQPIDKIVNILSNYERTMMPVEKKVLQIIKQISKNNPGVNLSGALKEIYPQHKKLLLRAQQSIFEEIMRLACDLPKDLYEEFTELMNITNKRLLNDPVVLPFSEREFLYKLRRIKDNIMLKNNRNEIHSINMLETIAKKIFNNDKKGKRAYGRNIKKKLEMQMRPEILKRNSSNLAEFKKFFEVSPLHNNEDIINLLENTSAKIHGFPSFANFERKSFIHELEKITRKLNNKKFMQEFDEISQKLPTSKENVSAFIVKYSSENNEKIGINLLLSGVCSVDHLVAKKNGGANKLANYGLTSISTNSKKTNIPFDEWVRMYPETAENCQKYVDRLIELYKLGLFAKVNKANKKLNQSYIEDFVKTIYEISPKEKRIELNISKLYE